MNDNKKQGLTGIKPYGIEQKKNNSDRLELTEVKIEITDNKRTRIEQSTTIKKTPEGAGTRVASSKERRLTPKEQAYVKIITTEPNTTKQQAIRRVYNVKPDAKSNTVANMANRIENRPVVLKVLNEYAVRSEELLKELAESSVNYALAGGKEGAMYASTAERTLNSVLDRVHGKAKQSLDIRQEIVQLNVDLSGE